MIRAVIRTVIRTCLACAAILALLSGRATAQTAVPPAFVPALPAGAALRPLAFADLEGWRADDPLAAMRPFLVTCRHLLGLTSPDTTGVAAPAGLAAVCREALAADLTRPNDARAFIERRFAPFEVVPASGRGFMTGYYEPEVPASPERTPDFTAPLLSRPADLVTLRRDEVAPGLPASLSAARRLADGSYAPFYDRGQILDGTPLEGARPLVWLRDAVEVFMVQVQGSTRVRFADGSRRRYAYDGKNGLPYTSIGRRIVEEGHVPLAEMNLDRMKDWLRAHPADADRIMRLNRSYVFFREATEVPAEAGPLGGSGVSLAARRSIAVDHGIWPYGLPFWLEAEAPDAAGIIRPLRRLTVAQDTGGAILGPARIDFFTGTGDAAGVWAGLLRHPVRVVVLLPRSKL